MVYGLLKYNHALERLYIDTHDRGRHYLKDGDIIKVQTGDSQVWKNTSVVCCGEGEFLLSGLFGPGEIPYDLTARLP